MKPSDTEMRYDLQYSTDLFGRVKCVVMSMSGVDKQESQHTRLDSADRTGSEKAG